MHPSHYHLHLEPNLEAFTFSARARLRFPPDKQRASGQPGARTVGSTEGTAAGRTVDAAGARTMGWTGDRITLHAVELEIQSCVLGGPNGATRDLRFQHQDGILTIDLIDATANVGTLGRSGFEIEITYTGTLNDRMAGFYRSRYTVDGRTRYMAVTQFEEEDARRAFPCVDEPWAKAVFEIELLAPRDHTALANTAVVSVEEGVGDRTEKGQNGDRLFRFEPTPPMSTYLVAFAVGQFDIAEDTSWRVPIRVAVSPGKKPQARTALEYARQSVSHLESTLGVPYPLSKLDSIGVKDFAFGAMENFGAITYRENLLLADRHTTRRELETMMEVAAHEISHMWFGDLVSPVSWRYVWLNEAFATYFGILVADYWYPQWRMVARFAGGDTGNAMGRDGMPHTVPIELADDRIELDPSTAPIIYHKGAAVLRMIHEFYGDEPFYRAVRTFLSEFSFQAIDTEQFVRVFARAFGPSFQIELLDRWIHLPGLPVVRVRREGETLHLRQHRFDYLNPDGDESVRGGPTGATWVVPVTATLGRGGYAASSPGGTARQDRETAPAGGKHCNWMLDQSEMEVTLSAGASWVKLNRNQTGYYRVFYEDEALWDALGRAAADKQLSPLDRFGLIADLKAFMRAGMVSLERYLCYLKTYFVGDTDPILVGEIADALTTLRGLLPEDGRLETAALDLLGRHRNAALEEPSDDEPYDRVLLREPVLRALTVFGDEATIERLSERARASRAGESVHPDVVPVALYAAAGSDSTTVQWMTDQLCLEATSEAQAIQYLGALSGVRDRAVAEDVVSFVARSVPSRNWLHFIRPASRNHVIAPLLWKWLQQSGDSILNIHPYHLSVLFASVIPRGALGEEEAAKVFLTDGPAAGRVQQGVVDLTLERLELNRRLIAGEHRPA